MKGKTNSSESQLDSERLELALQASNEGIWDWTVGEDDVFYSDRICGFFDRSAEEMPNVFAHPETVVHESDLEMFQELMTGACGTNGGDLLAIDCRLARDDGQGKWLRIRGSIVRNDAGDAVRMAGSMIDISRRKRAEAKVDEERHLLRLLIDNVPLSVFFKDADSNFALTNRRMVEWMKLDDPDVIIGKNDHDFFSLEHADAALKDEKRVMSTQEPILDKLEKETWSQRDDTWVQTSKFPWLNKNGEVIGTFGVSSDVTELIKSQQAMANLALKLKEKNEVMQEELLLAREIQNSFANPENRKLYVEGQEASLEMGSFYVPITDLAGDFYEVLHLSPGKVGVLISDVMGHGVRSALVVSMLRGLVERERKNALAPDVFLTGLNDGLSRILERAGAMMFSTAFYAVIDLDEMKLSFASAGHPSAIIRKGETVEQLDAEEIRGPALGIDGESEYGLNEVSLKGVDQILMFTDGIYEVADKDEHQLGQEALLDIVSSAPCDGVHRLLNYVVSHVEGFSVDGKFTDDVCLLGLNLKS